MVKVNINLSNNTTVFDCPMCGSEDIVYGSMPATCYSCGGRYRFSIDELSLYQSERKHHYVFGETTSFTGV